MSVRKPQAPEFDTSSLDLTFSGQPGIAEEEKEPQCWDSGCISQVGFATLGDELSASGRPLAGSRDWIREEPPSSGGSPTGMSGTPSSSSQLGTVPSYS